MIKYTGELKCMDTVVSTHTHTHTQLQVLWVYWHNKSSLISVPHKESRHMKSSPLSAFLQPAQSVAMVTQGQDMAHDAQSREQDRQSGRWRRSLCSRSWRRSWYLQWRVGTSRSCLASGPLFSTPRLVAIRFSMKAWFGLLLPPGSLSSKHNLTHG